MDWGQAALTLSSMLVGGVTPVAGSGMGADAAAKIAGLLRRAQ